MEYPSISRRDPSTYNPRLEPGVTQTTLPEQNLREPAFPNTCFANRQTFWQRVRPKSYLADWACLELPR